MDPSNTSLVLFLVSISFIAGMILTTCASQ